MRAKSKWKYLPTKTKLEATKRLDKGETKKNVVSEIA